MSCVTRLLSGTLGLIALILGTSLNCTPRLILKPLASACAAGSQWQGRCSSLTTQFLLTHSVRYSSRLRRHALEKIAELSGVPQSNDAIESDLTRLSCLCPRRSGGDSHKRPGSRFATSPIVSKSVPPGTQNWTQALTAKGDIRA